MSTTEEASKKTGGYLGTEPIGKLILKFSVPCVLSMLVSALYNIVDQVFIGQGVGYLGNAATNVVYPFTVFALAVSLMIGDGCAAFFSLSLGKGDEGAAHRSIGNGIVLTVIVSLLITAAGFLFADEILWMFGATEACFTYAKEYYMIILIGIPFYMFTSALNGAIRADGSPKYSMMATVIGQIVTCILTALYFRKPKSFHFQKGSFRPQGYVLRKVTMLGISSFIIQIAIVVVISVANNLIGRFGPESIYGADIPLSAVGIVMKVFAIVIAFSVGIAVGGQPIIGYNYGAGNYQRVLQTFRFIILANVAVGAVALLMFEVFPQSILSLFGNESALYNEYAVLCFRIYLSGIVLTCIQKGSSIFLQSIGKPVKSTILSLARDVVFFVPALLLLAPAFGVTGMLWAAPIADVLSIGVTVILVGMEYRTIRKGGHTTIPSRPETTTI